MSITSQAITGATAGPIVDGAAAVDIGAPVTVNFDQGESIGTWRLKGAVTGGGPADPTFAVQLWAIQGAVETLLSEVSLEVPTGTTVNFSYIPGGLFVLPSGETDLQLRALAVDANCTSVNVLGVVDVLVPR